MAIRSPSGTSTTGLPAGDIPAQDMIETDPLLESQHLAMIALLERAQRAAGTDATILLTGETGTGKDVLARQIHRWSPRRDNPLVVLNCTALAEHLLENELFGYVRRGFTGAVNDEPGRLEVGDGGTVLFDEIAELTLALQAKLLRFVQEQSLERIGSSRTIKANVRMIAASNRDLEEEVAARRFREDLYYRLNVIALRLPPLRERTLDILPLAGWKLRQMSLRARRGEFNLSPDAAAAFTSYRWPGNVRELHNAVERAANLAHNDTITFDDLPDSVCHPALGMRVPAHGMRLKDFEREHILRVLANSPTLEQAAATLGIDVTTLWRKRRHYGIG